jgi:saccharopine dehydrogenase (NAD+, L-lysine forming)
MSDGILIVGGYGAVGTVIASALAKHYRDRLIIAGRNAARAAIFAQTLGAGVRSRVMDVSQPIDYDTALIDVQYVIMCLDLTQIDFARQCLRRGIHYIDISAEYATLAAIAPLDGIAKQHQATAVLSVGLIPGLSNLMARHSLRVLPCIDSFDSAVLLGLGEKHGAAATLWTLDHLSDESGATQIQFPPPYGQRTVYRFAFPDQYTLPQTLPITTASSWLCFDSAFITHLIRLARLPLIRTLLQKNAVKQFSLNLLQRWQVGSDDFVLTTRARSGAALYQAWLSGKSEAEITGLVAAEVVHRMIAQPRDAGVFHIEQLFQLEEFLPLLEAHGITFSTTSQ